MPTASPPAVPPAHGGPVTDPILEQIIEIAGRVTTGTVTDAEATLFLLTAQPLLDELLQHRRKLALIADLSEPGNVLMFRGGR
ncbi:MAG: hypothetical protein V4712_17600 [Pseudomonadota bacterium]